MYRLTTTFEEPVQKGAARRRTIKGFTFAGRAGVSPVLVTRDPSLGIGLFDNFIRTECERAITAIMPSLRLKCEIPCLATVTVDDVGALEGTPAAWPWNGARLGLQLSFAPAA